MADFDDTTNSGTTSHTGNQGTSDTFVFHTASSSALRVTGARTGTVTGADTINSFETGLTGDRIKFLGATGGTVGVSIAKAAAITGTARSTLRTSDGREIRSHSVTNGIISFSGTSAFGQATPLTSNADVAAAVQYLRLLDLGETGSTVAFTATINGIPHTYIFIQGTLDGTDAVGTNAQDVLIDIVGKTAVALDFNATGIALVAAPANSGPPPIQQPDLAAGLSFWGNDNTFPVEVSDAVAQLVGGARQAPAATGSAEGGPSVAFISDRGVEVQFFDNLGIETVAGPEAASRLIVATTTDALGTHTFSDVLMANGVAALAVAWRDTVGGVSKLFMQGIGPEGGLPFGKPVQIGGAGAHSLQLAGYDVVDVNNAPVVSGINAVWVEGGQVFYQRYQIMIDPALGNATELKAAGGDGQVGGDTDAPVPLGAGSDPKVTGLHTGETVIVWLDGSNRLQAELIRAMGGENGAVDTVPLGDFNAANARLDELDNGTGADGVEVGTIATFAGKPAFKVVETGAGNFAIVWVEQAPSGFVLKGMYYAIPPDTGPAAGVVLPGGDGWTPIVINPIALNGGFTGEFNLAGMGEDNPDIVLTYTANDGNGTGVYAQHISGEMVLNAGVVQPITVAAAAIRVNDGQTGNQTGGAVAGMVSDRAIITYTDDDGTVHTRIVDLRDVGAGKGQYLIGDRIVDRNADGLLNSGDRVRGRPDVIVGTVRDDVIIGDLVDPTITGVRFDDPQGDDDQLYGSLGNDFIFGGGGTLDIIDGGNDLNTQGQGTDPTLNSASATYKDVSLYLGNLLNTNITISGDGSYSVMDARFDDGDGFVDTLANGTLSADGLDFVSNIEELWFLDGNVAPIRAASYATDLAAAIQILNGITPANKVVTANLFHLPTDDARLTGNVSVNANGTFTPGDTNPLGVETVLTPVAWALDDPLMANGFNVADDVTAVEKAPVVAALIEGFATGWEVDNGGGTVGLQMKVYDLLGKEIPNAAGVATIDIATAANPGSLAIAGTGVGTVAAWTEGAGILKVQAFGLENQPLGLAGGVAVPTGAGASNVTISAQSLATGEEQFTVAWQNGAGVQIQRYDIALPNGVETSFDVIGPVISIAGATAPSVTGLHDGEVAIAYRVGNDLKVSIIPPGQSTVGIADTRDIVGETLDAGSEPTILAAGEGEIAVGWLEGGRPFISILPILDQWTPSQKIALSIPTGATNVAFAVAGESDIAVIVTWQDATGLHGQRFAYAADVQKGIEAGDKVGDVFDIAAGLGSGTSAVAGMLDGRFTAAYAQDGNTNVDARIYDTRSAEAPEIGRDAGGPRDFMVGTVFDDIMDGRDRADILYGALGNDVLIGGTGDDELFGGDGNDSLFGATGTDVLVGDTGNDYLQGGYGRDYIAGGDGNDTLSYRGELRAVTVDLAAGTVRTKSVDASAIVQWDQTATLQLATGSNEALRLEIFNGSADLEDVLGSISEVNHEAAIFEFSSNHSIENVEGGLGNDTITGDDRDNVIEGGAGGDTLNGGAGNDTLSYAGSSAGVTVNLSTNTFSGADADGDVISGFENVTGSAFRDIITGTGTANVIEGGKGDDTLNGGGGNDIFNYKVGDGADDVRGDANTDLLNITGSGRLEVTTANPTTLATVGGGTLTSVERAIANLTGTNDTLSYASNTTGVTVNLTTGAAMGFRTFTTSNPQTVAILGVENVTGSALNDALTGDANANVLEGLAGNDTLNGGGGADILVGGADGDVLNGGAGSDTASYAGSSDGVSINLATATYSGGDAAGDTLTSIENLIGSAFADTLTGGGGANILEGGAGADSLNGGNGLDTASYAGSSAGVSINLATATYSGGDAAGDTLSSIENVTGSAFADNIVGSAIVNVLTGGAGDDMLTGGAGADVFVFAAGFGHDTITDFVSSAAGQDRIDITSYSLTAGTFAANVTIAASGASDTLVSIGADNILLKNVVSTTVDVSDFILA